jgi:hypothetical protein
MATNGKQHQAKQDVKKRGINSTVAAVTGAIVGAGIAIAGTMALENKENRKKIKKAFTDVKDQAAGYMEKIQKEVKDRKDDIEKKLADGQKEVKKIVNSAKDTQRVTHTKREEK